MSGPIAFIADIHGNIWALDAVLADIRRRGIEAIFNLGDSVYGPLDPRGVADCLVARRIPSLRGNQDRILLEPLAGKPHPTLRYTLASLDRSHFDWLRDQPCTIEHGDFFLCHGTPAEDDVYLTEAVTAVGVGLRGRDELQATISSIAQGTVLCGHSHIPRVLKPAPGRLIINPGSVGLPAYSDDAPHPHRMETGSPHARYAIIEDGIVSLIAVAYDYRNAAARARVNGRPDWASALETGCV